MELVYIMIRWNYYQLHHFLYHLPIVPSLANLGPLTRSGITSAYSIVNIHITQIKLKQKHNKISRVEIKV